MVLFSIFILKESPTFIQILFFLLAFLGVVVLKQTPQELTLMGVVLGLLAALFSGLAYTYIRKLRETDHPLVVVFYFPLLILMVFAPYMFFKGFLATTEDLLKILSMGLVSFIGQIFLTLSYQSNQGADVGILHYVGLVYALGIGYFYYNEVPDGYQFVGMLLIVISVILHKKHSHKIKKGLKVTAP